MKIETKVRAFRFWTVRHGQFDELYPNWLGPQQANEAATRLAKYTAGHAVVLLTSPVMRARQTAEIIGTALHTEPLDVEWLRPSGAASTKAELVDFARDFAPEVQLVMVTHQPNIGAVTEISSARNGQIVPGQIFL